MRRSTWKVCPRRADDKRLEKAVEVLQEQGKGGATEGKQTNRM
jgi:hypothetical protein